MEKTIEDGNMMAVFSTIGGTAIEVSYGDDLIIFPQEEIAGKLRGGIPFCFPWFGMPEGYSQRHGWLRNQELEVISESKKEVVFGGENEATAEYPWQFQYTIRARLAVGLRLYLRLRAERVDNEPSLAPVNPGIHPYFRSDNSFPNFYRCLAKNGDEIYNDSDFNSKSVGVNLNKPVFIQVGKGKRISMHLQHDASHAVLWSDRQEEYFCFEPVLTNPNLYGKAGGRYVAKGQEIEMFFMLQVCV